MHAFALWVIFVASLIKFSAQTDTFYVLEPYGLGFYIECWVGEFSATDGSISDWTMVYTATNDIWNGAEFVSAVIPQTGNYYVTGGAVAPSPWPIYELSSSGSRQVFPDMPAVLFMQGVNESSLLMYNSYTHTEYPMNNYFLGNPQTDEVTLLASKSVDTSATKTIDVQNLIVYTLGYNFSSWNLLTGEYRDMKYDATYFVVAIQYSQSLKTVFGLDNSGKIVTFDIQTGEVTHVASTGFSPWGPSSVIINDSTLTLYWLTYVGNSCALASFNYNTKKATEIPISGYTTEITGLQLV